MKNSMRPTALLLAILITVAALAPGLGAFAANETKISSHPQSVTITAGYTCTFSVAATGDNLRYQWQISRDGGAIFTDITGATGASYNTGVCALDMNGSRYRVKVTGDDGVTVTSNAATLSVTVISTPSTPGGIGVTPGGSSGTTGTTGTNGVKVDYTLKNKTDAVLEIDAAKEDSIILGLGTAAVCTFDLALVSHAKTCHIPKSFIDKLSAKGVGLAVRMPQGSISLDAKAVSAISADKTGQEVIVTVAGASGTSLSAAQNQAAGTMLVMEISVKSGSTGITDFAGGSAEIAIPYALQYGETPDGVCVWHIDYSGTKKNMNAIYEFSSKRAVFKSSALPYFIIGYDENPQWANPFTDVLAGDWFYENVQYVSQKGLFNGTSSTTFSPQTSMSRGMFITVLGRVAGAGVSQYVNSSFSDVKAGMYYLGYIEWAAEKGIIERGETFSPDVNISREDMALFMHNYSTAMGQTLAKSRASETFSDDAQISQGAKAAVYALYEAGVINGKGGGVFDPKGDMKRCEAAAVLQRYVGAIGQ